MRRLLLAIVFLGMTVCVASAESLSVTDTLKKIPALKAGVGYSLIDNKINALSTVELARWKGITLEAGIAGDADSTDWKAIGVISYDLLKLKNYVDLPILNLIEFQPGLYAGAGGLNLHRIMESEIDAGVSLTLVNIKW
jgi:hypothetical protein